MSFDSLSFDRFNAWRASRSGFLRGPSSPSHDTQERRTSSLDYAGTTLIACNERAGHDSPILFKGPSLNRLCVRAMRAIDS
ncbi:hypothetical protein Patl1_11274 [Pistacia atlantica]|uniref:Uncharacterized protein n=1 Tax=Pistacia atlantica TaxID=434234 RepID=A0ACC1A8G2_9ROSI|nr:hypothetical protein Patl1_11274 [Pistacia atlantica]